MTDFSVFRKLMIFLVPFVTLTFFRAATFVVFKDRLNIERGRILTQIERRVLLRVTVEAIQELYRLLLLQFGLDLRQTTKQDAFHSILIICCG